MNVIAAETVNTGTTFAGCSPLILLCHNYDAYQWYCTVLGFNIRPLSSFKDRMVEHNGIRFLIQKELPRFNW